MHASLDALGIQVLHYAVVLWQGVQISVMKA